VKRSIEVWVLLCIAVVATGAWLLYEADLVAEHADFWSVAVPGILTGVGTLALAVSTVVLAYQDRSRTDKRFTATAEKERHSAEREQAEAISAWPLGHPNGMGPGETPQPQMPIYIVNGSSQLIYEVAIWNVFIQGAAPHTGEDWVQRGEDEPYWHQLVAIAAVPPGRWEVSIDFDTGPPQSVRGVEVAFTDRSGTTWLRRATGPLEKLSQAAPEHYGLARPLSYRSPALWGTSTT